jgi:hypothetical protein
MKDGRRLITGADPYLLRTCLDFLMLHAMMLRGESTWKAELADLCSVLLPDEGSEYLGLVLRTSVGKTIPLAMGGNLPYAVLPRGVTPSGSGPLPRRRSHLLAGTSLGDLPRDPAGFPAPLVVIHHEGTSG